VKSRILSVLLLLALSVLLVPGALCPSARATASVDDQTVTDAYIYLLGRYLIIRQEKIDQDLTKVGYNTLKYNPLGKADFVNPNMDVAYLDAWLAVDEKAPALLTVPKITGRYYTVEIIDEWGNTIGNINPRETPNTPYGNFVFLLKGSHPPLPKGATPIELPSKKAKLLARIALQSTPSEAVKLQYDFKLRSLGKPAITPPLVFPVFTNIKLIGVEIFDNVDKVLASAADRMPSAHQLQDKVRAVAAAVTSNPEERKRIAAILKTKSIPAFFEMTRGFGTQRGGWSVAYTAGDYGERFDLRTIGNYLSIWANTTKEVIYFSGNKDADGYGLSGNHIYTIHFPKELLPADFVDAFWSLTVLTLPDYRVVPNRLKRYSLNSFMKFQHESDGSLRLILASEPPPGVPDSNWIPSQRGRDITLTLRLYLPKESVLNGTWFAPPIEKKN
jgi:hypothetical protein